jgi:hypothetical protein
VAFKKSYVITTAKSLKRAIGHVYTLKRSIAEVEQRRNDAVSDAELDATNELAPLQAELDAIMDAVWTYVRKHLSGVFGGASKALFPRASLGRKPTTATEVLDEKFAVKALRELGAEYAVVTKETVSVSTLNAHPDLIEKLEKQYPGAIIRHKRLNLRLDFLPRGKKDQLGASLTSELYQQELDKD